jgi:carbon storage regulator CsrA
MLVLTRKLGQKVVIGQDITVTILAVMGNKVRLGIEAPDHIRVLRSELACWHESSGQGSELEPEAIVPAKG